MTDTSISVAEFQIISANISIFWIKHWPKIGIKWQKSSKMSIFQYMDIFQSNFLTLNWPKMAKIIKNEHFPMQWGVEIITNCLKSTIFSLIFWRKTDLKWQKLSKMSIFKRPQGVEITTKRLKSTFFSLIFSKPQHLGIRHALKSPWILWCGLIMNRGSFEFWRQSIRVSVFAKGLHEEVQSGKH